MLPFILQLFGKFLRSSNITVLAGLIASDKEEDYLLSPSHVIQAITWSGVNTEFEDIVTEGLSVADDLSLNAPTLECDIDSRFVLRVPQAAKLPFIYLSLKYLHPLSVS